MLAEYSAVVPDIAFWIIAVAMGLAALRVVTTKNIVHAALYLVVVLAGAAALYILLTAEFVGWVQVLVYIGAVVILFLFGIMLTRAPRTDTELDNNQRWAAAIVALFFMGVLIVLLVDAFGAKHIVLNDDLRASGRLTADFVKHGHNGQVVRPTVGSAIFQQYVLPFEAISMLLLAALVGAVAMARRD